MRAITILRAFPSKIAAIFFRRLFFFCGTIAFTSTITFTSATAFTSTTWASPISQDIREESAPADMYLRLSNMRCEDCTLIIRDLIEMGAVDNTIGAVKRVLDDSNYSFRVSLLSTCSNCYQAVHFWEMFILKRAAKNEEINHWLESSDSKFLVELFSK